MTTIDSNDSSNTTIYIEGNIGAGKTTLLAAVREQLTKKEDLLPHFSILSEPQREGLMLVELTY